VMLSVLFIASFGSAGRRRGLANQCRSRLCAFAGFGRRRDANARGEPSMTSDILAGASSLDDRQGVSAHAAARIDHPVALQRVWLPRSETPVQR